MYISTLYCGHHVSQHRVQVKIIQDVPLIFFKEISEGLLPVERTPVSTLALRTDVYGPAFLSLYFHGRDKFRFAFFAFVEVHHFAIKERLRLKKPFFS